MHRFYFNDALPSNNDLYGFVALLSNTILEFNSLQKTQLTIAPMVVTAKLPAAMTVCGEYSLKDAIQNIENKDLKSIAFSIFDKGYPIHEYFHEDESWIEDILRLEYKVKHGEEVIDATNLAIVAKNQGLLFSVPLHTSQAVNTVTLQTEVENASLSLVNLFGNKSNTDFVSSHILAIDAASRNKLEQLKHTIGPNSFNNTFEKGFSALALAEQESVLVHFERAKARNQKTPFGSDGSLIKDVTPENSKFKVLELRIFSPTALRVYFYEEPGKIYLASIEHKSNADQNNDIKKAEKVIQRLLLTS
ncbi:hypothetical protein [Runella sp.]|uniref:hypothetical protein n=1 Tax=Runella sp. TaxID=1960881 RepID=UPI0030189230